MNSADDNENNIALKMSIIILINHSNKLIICIAYVCK